MKQRLSVSLPAELVAWVRDEARGYGVPVSHVVEAALRRQYERDLSRAMLEGLLADNGVPPEPEQVARLAELIHG